MTNHSRGVLSTPISRLTLFQTGLTFPRKVVELPPSPTYLTFRALTYSIRIFWHNKFLLTTVRTWTCCAVKQRSRPCVSASESAHLTCQEMPVRWRRITTTLDNCQPPFLRRSYASAPPCSTSRGTASFARRCIAALSVLRTLWDSKWARRKPTSC